MLKFGLENPFDPDVSLSHTQHKESIKGAGGKAPDELPSPEKLLDRAVESAVVRAVFGQSDPARRQFLKLVGSSTAAAILSSIFPLDAAKALAQEKIKGIEKKDLSIGFIPITCAGGGHLQRQVSTLPEMVGNAERRENGTSAKLYFEDKLRHSRMPLAGSRRNSDWTADKSIWG